MAAMVLLFSAGCKPAARLESSGAPEVDQTAEFLFEVVSGLRSGGKLESSDEIARYLTSARGKSEYWPAHQFYESDAAERYNGLRPSDEVAVWDKPYDIGRFRFAIIVSSDSNEDKIVLRAYELGTQRLVHTWKF